MNRRRAPRGSDTMYDNAKFKSFCADVCARYEAHKDDVHHMVEEESETIEAEYKRAGRRLTYRATVEAVHAAIERCQKWLDEPPVETVTPERVATFRRSAIYFSMLKKRGAPPHART